MLVATQVGIGLLSVIALAALVATRAHRAREGFLPLMLLAVMITGGALADSSFVTKPVYVQAAISVLFVYTAVTLFLLARKAEFRPLPAGGFALLFLWAWLLLRDLLSSTPPHGLQLAGRLLSGVVLSLAVYIVRWRALSLQTVATMVTVTLALIGLSVAALPDPWRPCDRFKCGTFGALLTGPFPSENFLGILSAWCCGLALLTLRGWLRASTVALSLLILVATGSRSSAIAVTVVAGAYWLFQRRSSWLVNAKEEAGTYALRTWVSVGLVLGFLALAVYLLFSADPTTFSNRGVIWMSALSALEGSFPQGLGLDRWDPLTQIGLLPAHFPHSGYLLVLFSGGFIGLALFALAIWRTASHEFDSAREPLVRAGVIQLFMALSLTEVLWNPLTIDGLTWTALCLLLPLRPDSKRLANAADELSTALTRSAPQ